MVWYVLVQRKIRKTEKRNGTGVSCSTDLDQALCELLDRGVASLNLKVSRCMRKRNIYKQREPDEMPQNAASHQGLRCLPR